MEISMTQREEAKKYWFSKLKGLENSVQMDEMGKKFRSYNKGTIRKSLNRDMTGKLMTLCKSDSWLLFTFLLAAVKIVIYKFTGESDITVCSPIFYDGENIIQRLYTARYFIPKMVAAGKTDGIAS